jgi:putative membrane protein
VYAAVLAWSATDPKGYDVWLLEVLPALLGFGVLAATRGAFPLTPLAYWLALAHCIVLMVGGHYTYAEVPLFDWIRDALGHSRNNYDKLGHFAQGFVPAILCREVLLRLEVIRRPGWLPFLVVCFCLALSAFYELVEWWVALLSEEAGDAFLGTQGYVWDTQSDMAVALLGAVLALGLLRRLHDRQLAALRPGAP